MPPVLGVPVVEGRRKSMHRCTPLCKAAESRTHVVGECEMYKEEWDVLRDEDSRRMRHGKKFGALYSSEKMIAILGDRW